MGTIALYLNPIQTTGAFKTISNFKLDLLQIVPTMTAKLSIDHKYLGVDQTFGMIGISTVLSRGGTAIYGLYRYVPL